MTKIPRRVYAITRKKYVLQKISQHARQRMVHNDSHISSTTNCFGSSLSLSLYRQYLFMWQYMEHKCTKSETPFQICCIDNWI